MAFPQHNPLKKKRHLSSQLCSFKMLLLVFTSHVRLSLLEKVSSPSTRANEILHAEANAKFAKVSHARISTQSSDEVHLLRDEYYS